MQIGLDFDNTIVKYDAIFHKKALEQGLIHLSVPINKISIRDHLRKLGREEDWTTLQGYVYGKCMMEADIFEGVMEVLQTFKNKGHTLFIISHKTQFPYLGPPYDLHESARHWILQKLKLISEQQIFFELTKDAKLKRIAECRCDIFVDDLPEIILSEDFPKTTKPILFDPEQQYNNVTNIERIFMWDELKNVA